MTRQPNSPSCPVRPGHPGSAPLRGLSTVCTDDQVLELTGPLFGGRYEYRRRAILLDREPA